MGMNFLHAISQISVSYISRITTPQNFVKYDQFPCRHGLLSTWTAHSTCKMKETSDSKLVKRTGAIAQTSWKLGSESLVVGDGQMKTALSFNKHQVTTAYELWLSREVTARLISTSPSKLLANQVPHTTSSWLPWSNVFLFNQQVLPRMAKSSLYTERAFQEHHPKM